MDKNMEQIENRPLKNWINKVYNKKYNSKAGSYQFEEGTTSSSSFLEVDDQKGGSMKSNVANSNMSTTTMVASLTSALEIDNQITDFNATDIEEYSSDVPGSDTLFCMTCLKRKVRTPATLFCESCQPYGKYICHACLQQHNVWCPDHTVLSLSVKRQKADEWRLREGNIPVTRGSEEYGYIESWLDTKPADGNLDVPEGRDEIGTITSLDFPSTLNHFTDKRPLRVPIVHSADLLTPPLPAFKSRQPPLPPMLPPTLELKRESSSDESHISDFADYESIGTHLRPVSGGSDNWKLTSTQLRQQQHQQQQQQHQQLQITEPRKDHSYTKLANHMERQDTISQTRSREHEYNTLDRLGDIYTDSVIYSHDYTNYRTTSIPDIPRLPITTQKKKRCSIM